jgi:hypothetical protein
VALFELLAEWIPDDRLRGAAITAKVTEVVRRSNGRTP